MLARMLHHPQSPPPQTGPPGKMHRSSAQCSTPEGHSTEEMRTAPEGDSDDVR